MSLNRKNLETYARAYKAFAAAKPVNAVPSRTLTNATTIGDYRGNAMASPRADADNNLQHASCGLGVQIVRAV